jgi:SMODS-associated and fused to various effectors sensor domain
MAINIPGQVGAIGEESAADSSAPPQSEAFIEFRDRDLAAWISKIARSKEDVLVIASMFTSRVLCRSQGEVLWVDVGGGEFGLEALESAKPLIKSKRFWWAVAETSLESVNPTDVSPVNATIAQVKSWITSVDSVTGREAEASSKTREEVAYLAAWRCQFSGCGKNLRSHTTTGARGRFSYFAHIVAASERGPRGDAVLSAHLADDPKNIMLLCDECHRLIDRVSPKKYDAQTLQKMRECSIQEVTRILDALQYPEAVPLVILGNITGQAPQFSDRDAEEALWGSKLRASAGRTERILSFQGVLHDPHSAGYWDAAIRHLRSELPRLQSYINGSLYGESRPKVAVFPLHGTSILILAGRVLGDTSGTHLFQPHRNKVGEVTETRWAWPENAPPPAREKFKLRTLRENSDGSKEACLIVSLTYPIGHTRLPRTCFDQADFVVPTLEIYIDSPSGSAIGHHMDLQLFGKAFDDALKILQDQWRVENIHLVLGAPATACVVAGQKMQARNHANFICHESKGGPGEPFLPTIKISSTHVRHLASNQSISLQP